MRRRTVASQGLAADQKKARRLGASIVFIDETGFRLQPVNRRTWAPCGVPPVQRAWDRYDRLNVISAVALSPGRQRISLPFQIFSDNIRTAEVVTFVKQLRHQHAAGQTVTLDIYEGMPHVFQVKQATSPESKTALRKVDAFLKRHMSE